MFRLLTTATLGSGLFLFSIATAQERSADADSNAAAAAASANAADGVESQEPQKGPPRVGQLARDFVLNDLEGKKTQFSRMLEHGPAALIVLRGFPGYQCPICSRQVDGLIRRAKDFQTAGVQVVMVYPGPAENLDVRAKEFIQGKEFPTNFHFLVDPGYGFTNQYDLRWDEPRETAYPTSLLVDRDRKVFFAKVSDSHGGRASAEDLLEAIKNRQEADRSAREVSAVDALPAVGQIARDFSLQDLQRRKVQLSKLVETGPVALVVLRGFPGYQCPICNRQVDDLIKNAAGFADAGAQVVFVYPGPAENLDARAREFVEGKEFPENFHFLVDPAYRFTNSYHLRWDAPRETAYPTTLLIDGERKVFFAKVSRTHRGRASAKELLDVMAKQTEQAAKTE